MTIQYMDEGFAPHVDRGLEAAKAGLRPGRLNGETGKHTRSIVEHILALEPERVPAVTTGLFAEALVVANAVRQAHGKGPVSSFRARDFWEILKDLIGSVLEH